jgi:hypothetical protein
MKEVYDSFNTNVHGPPELLLRFADTPSERMRAFGGFLQGTPEGCRIAGMGNTRLQSRNAATLPTVHATPPRTHTTAHAAQPATPPVLGSPAPVPVSGPSTSSAHGVLLGTTRRRSDSGHNETPPTSRARTTPGGCAGARELSRRALFPGAGATNTSSAATAPTTTTSSSSSGSTMCLGGGGGESAVPLPPLAFGAAPGVADPLSAPRQMEGVSESLAVGDNPSIASALPAGGGAELPDSGPDSASEAEQQSQDEPAGTPPEAEQQSQDEPAGTPPEVRLQLCAPGCTADVPHTHLEVVHNSSVVPLLLRTHPNADEPQVAMEDLRHLLRHLQVADHTRQRMLRALREEGTVGPSELVWLEDLQGEIDSRPSLESHPLRTVVQQVYQLLLGVAAAPQQPPPVLASPPGQRALPPVFLHE